MSRVGLNPIMVPDGVQYNFSDHVFSVNGKKASMSLTLDVGFEIEQMNDSMIMIKRPNDNKDIKAKHGLYRSLIANMFEGLSKGFKKELEVMEKNILSSRSKTKNLIEGKIILSSSL